MTKTPLTLLLASLLSANAFATPSTHERLTTLAQDMVQTSAHENPMFATTLGIHPALASLEMLLYPKAAGMIINGGGATGVITATSDPMTINGKKVVEGNLQ